jgi:hypothetical protein
MKNILVIVLLFLFVACQVNKQTKEKESSELVKSASPAIVQQYVPTRFITKGPKHHWFGYYDKLEFDPTGRYVLSNEVDFEGRSPNENDVIKVGMIDLEDGDKWIGLGESRAWGWQQGCMLQFLPNSTPMSFGMTDRAISL